MRTSPEKRNPSGSEEKCSWFTKFRRNLGRFALAGVIGISSPLAACSAQGGGEQVTPPSTTATDEAPTATPIISETLAPNPTSEATTQESPSPTEPQTSEATADTTENAAPEEYTMPKNAKPAKDMVNGFFANYTIDDISNMRPLGETLRHSEERLTETAQLLGAIHVNALEVYERAASVGSELNKDNPLLHDIHKMPPQELARALNLPLFYAMLENGDDIVTWESVGKSEINVDRAKKLACLHMCSGSSNQWVRFRDFLDGYSQYRKKPPTTERYIDITDPGQPTAVITESQMVEVGGLGKAELVTIQRKGDNLEPESEREWEERWLLVPYSALPELPGINGESSERDPSFNDPVDFNRPRPDGNGGYVTLDGTPAIIPVLLN